MAADLILGMSGPLTKEVEVVDSGYVSHPSLRRRRWLIEGAEEIAWLFGAAEKLSKSPLRQLLCSAVAKAELIFFRFPISSAWELSKALLGLLRLVRIESYIYKVSQAPCLLSQV